MNKQVWLVRARRGDYSDRTEYAVCWYSTEQDAKSCAERMQAGSAMWRRRCADADNPWDRVQQAQADIGDSQWNYFDDTDYSAFALERGGKVKWRLCSTTTTRQSPTSRSAPNSPPLVPR